jgi:predicted transcriptional regulator
MDYIQMSIQEVTLELKKKGISQVKQGKIFGVSPLQIHNYQTGHSKSPGIEVVKKVLDHVKFEDKSVLINTFNNMEDFNQAWTLHQKGIE